MAATTAPSRPPPTAVVTTAVLDQARAASARAHPARVITRAARYAVSVASGRAKAEQRGHGGADGRARRVCPRQVLPHPGQGCQHRQVRALLTGVAQRRAVPAVEPGMPQRAGVRPHADQLAAGQAGLETVQQAAGEVSAGEQRDDGGDGDRDDAGVAGSLRHPGRREDVQVERLVGHRAALQRREGLDGGVRPVAGAGVEDDLVVQQVGRVPQGRAGAHEEPGQVAAAQAVGCPASASGRRGCARGRGRLRGQRARPRRHAAAWRPAAAARPPGC